MGYVLSLFFIIGLIFYIFSGSVGNNFVVNNDLFSNITSKVNDKIFPKTEKEILIENLNGDYNVLDKFFSNSAPKILKSKDIPSEDKALVSEAISAFEKSKTTLKEIENLQKKEKSITKTLIEKVLETTETTSEAQSSPIPPQCHLECSE